MLDILINVPAPNPELLVQASYLTELAKNNRGVFPFDRVHQIIDGRAEVKDHGPRDMPVWGYAFRHQSSCTTRTSRTMTWSRVRVAAS